MVPGNSSKLLFLMLNAALVLEIAGCASIPPPYVPDETAAKSMTPLKARNLLYANLRPNGSGWRNPSLNDIGITNIQINTLNMVISTAEPATRVFQLKNLEVRVKYWGPTSTAWATPEESDIHLHKGDDYHDWYIGFAGRADGLAENIANALVVLKKAALEREAAEADVASFEDTVRAYRQAAVKPVVPEEARAYTVQAESAVRDKQFEEAADLYGNAIRIAPWWPSAHFNSAVMFGETGDYVLAIGEMKRYLLLAPDAPNARVARDHIYGWQRKAAISE